MTHFSPADARRMGMLPPKKQKPVRVSAATWDAKLIPGGVWLQIPEIPPSLNVWKNWHWRKQGEYKKQLSKDIGKLKMAFRLPRFKLATVQAIIYFPVRRVRDPSDNYNQKFTMDALVRGGILEDDRGDWVKVMVPELKIDRARPRVEIFIWEAMK